MMMESPKSLTAIVHVKFNYKEPEAKSVSQSELEMVSQILNRASGLSPEHQDLLINFVNYLNGLRQEDGERSPA